MTSPKKPQPLLQITATGSRNLGRCYHATTFQIVSSRQLSRDQIRKFRDEGFLGYGQEFNFIGEGELVKADTVFNADEYVIQTLASVYVYKVEDRVDSSD